MGNCVSSDMGEEKGPAVFRQRESADATGSTAAVKEDKQPAEGGEAIGIEVPPTPGALSPSPSPSLQHVPARKMKLKELRAATNDFADDQVLGEGSFGKVYQGTILSSSRSSLSDRHGAAESPKRIQVAVKKLNADSFQGYQEWLAEVLLLERLRHPNLVRLLGFCNERQEALLVYELCSHGALDAALAKGVGEERAPLTWPQRVQVCKDITAGLAFLHKHNIIHRDFKASNVLLVEGYRAKVTDFGLAKAGPDGKQTHVSTRVLGTMGYLDPTYLTTGRLTKKSDTYALGVTILELVTGRQSMGMDGSEPLTTWIKPHLLQRRPDLKVLVDPKLGAAYSLPGIVKLTILAKHCIAEDPALRPDVEVIVEGLEKVEME